MKNHIIQNAAAAALALLAVLLPVCSFAGTNIPVTVAVSVTYIVEGNAGTAGGDSFTLAPDDPASPMPDGTVAGKKTIKISDEGSFSFGDICYEKPGVHWYTVTRELTDKKGVVKDNSVYRAKVIALNDGHGYVLVFKSGSDKKRELVYTDKVAPDTGDRAEVLLWGCAALAATVSLAVIAAVRRINKERKAEHEIQ